MSPRQINEQTVFWSKLGAAIFAVALLTVWEHVEAVRLDRQLISLRKETDRLTYENGRLQKEIHLWTSPSHLDAVARQQYKMEPLDPSHVIGVHK